MRIPLRWATGLAAAGCIVAIGMAAWAVARTVSERALTAQGHRHLAAATAAGAALLRGSQDVPLDSLVLDLALATGYRASVFGADLELIADSHLARGAFAADSAAAARRTEVAGALSRARSTATRRSALDERRYLFSANRFPWGGRQVVLRLGSAADPLREAASRAALWVALAVAAAGAVALLVIDRGSRRAAGVLDDIRRVLGRIGEKAVRGSRARLPALIEFARVASAANRVRGEVEAQVGRVTRERDELAQLMDEVGEGLMALTDDARVLRINPTARRLLGVTAVVPFSPVGSIIRDPVLRDLLELSVVRPEARMEVRVGDRELEVRTKRGTAGGAVVLLVDITEIRRLEAVRSDFVANASHELKTPLTVIRAAAETVLDEEMPSDLRAQFLRSIEGNTVRLQRLVDDLLDLSRYESGAWRPEREPVAVAAVAAAAWQDMEDAWSGRNIDFQVGGQGDALGDEAAIYQIFRNLLENALRYVEPDTGRIAVNITQSAHHLVVAVDDNGSGIPASALPRIFERFYRVDAARSRHEGGTGLGLAIVRHLVSSMGGLVDALSVWGVGTTITFTLPLAGAAPAVTSVGEPAT